MTTRSRVHAGRSRCGWSAALAAFALAAGCRTTEPVADIAVIPDAVDAAMDEHLEGDGTNAATDAVAADALGDGGADVSTGDCGPPGQTVYCLVSYGPGRCGDAIQGYAMCVGDRWVCPPFQTPGNECSCSALADSGGCPCTPHGYDCSGDAGPHPG